MKSRIKTNSKIHIVIAFGTGIAAARSLEAAMLFSRAGFDIHPIFLNEAEKWLGAEAIRQACNHSIAGSEILSDSPKWFVPTWKGYELAIVFEPNDFEIQEFFGKKPTDHRIKHITNLSEFILICSNKTTNPEPYNSEKKFKFLRFPENQGLYSNFFFDLFSYSTNYLFNKQLKLTYSVTDNSQSFRWKKDLEEAFTENGISQINESAKIQITIHENDIFEVTLLNKPIIKAKTLNNGIIINYGDNERFLPTISGQSAFNRLVQFIITENKRLSTPSTL